jgi:serine/threonine protein kinase
VRPSQEEVALKMIPSNIFNKNKEATEREVAILKKIGDHPHIVKLVRVDRTKKHFLIAMELLLGGELFERICAREKYTEEDARVVTKQLLDAIAFLHKQNVAHRDLKPENVIYATKSDNSLVKVTDFGFANVYDPENRFVNTCGTPLYVAPEILDGVAYDVQCDMWSLGVIVFILLCGYPPFFGDDDDELFYRIRHAHYEFLSPHWDPISSEAKDFLVKLFELNPRKRMTAVDALAHPWISKISSSSRALASTQQQLKRTQCKKKLVKGVFAVIAMNRIKRATAPL